MDKSLAKTRTSLNSVNKALRFNPGNTDLIKQKQTLLGKSIDQTKQKLARLKAEEDKLKQSDGFDENSEDAQRLRREIIETESKLKSLNRQASKISTVIGTKMQAAGKTMQNFGRSVSAVGDRMTTSVTLPLAAAGTMAAKKFAEVDKTMQLTNATMKNTEAEAKQINDAMKEAAANSTFGMNDAATASLNFARAGLDAAQASAALAPAMNLAAGEGGNLDTVSAGLVATINGFHGSFDDATHYADVFANACNNSALDIDSLSNAMSVAAPIFSAAGYKVDDAALYMGVMANNGIEASKAANSLKTGIARLIKPTDEAEGWMKRLGISMTNADGTMKDSVTVQKEMHESFKDLSESEQIAAASAIFGKNQMAPWLALINTAPADVNKLASSLKNEGTTAEMAEAMMSGFGGSIEKLKSSIDVAATSLGEALAPTIRSISDRIQSAVDAFNAMDESQQQAIVKTALMVAAAGPLLSVGGRIITGVGKLVTITGKAINGIGALAKGTVAFSGSTALGAVAAAAALAGGLYAIHKSGDKAYEKLYGLDKEEKEHINTLKSATDSYNELDKARVEATASAVSDAEYAHSLVDEYNGLVNSHGRVKKGYEDRAAVIKGQLAEALGVEKSKIDELIGKNGQLKASIERLIETKKAEAILDANKDTYTAAIKERQDAVSKLGPALADIKTKETEYAAAQAEVAQRQKEYNNYVEMGGRNTAGFKTRLEEAQRASDAAGAAVDKQKAAVEGYEQTLAKANAEITNYEGLAKAIESKDTAAIQQWSTVLTSGIKTRENAVRQELEAQAQAISEEYELIKQAYENGEAGITEDMVKAAKERADAANTEAGVVTENAKKQASERKKTAANEAASVSRLSNMEKNAVSRNSAAAKNAATANTAAAKKNVSANLDAAASSASKSFGKISKDASTEMSKTSSAVTSSTSTIKNSFPVELGQLFHGTMVNIVTKVKEEAGGAKSISQSVQKARFARGYTNPLLFTSPTLLGNALFGDRGNAYGGEMIYSRGKLMGDITEAISKAPISSPPIYITVNGADSPEMWANRFADELLRRTRSQ